MRAFIIAAVLLVAGMIFGVSAHEGATGMVKMRMDAMSAISKNMKSIAATLKSGQSADIQSLELPAREIGEHASSFPAHFNERKMDPISEAAPAIWEQPEKFRELSDALTSHAATFADLVSTNAPIDELEAEFRSMSGTCKACHEVFRIKK